ncbi:hypothetical protein DW182_06355 [Bacteroides sp. AM16-24]|uniref:hypothetical protein n=1 Tax=Bacteroides sp. AM16-24 TaxID=2292002 RepID=UPI000E527162|nr:hypothetical protein [Bacteroides sp. AM16-24]RHI09837.1 hypothetical protein DW182_06355 [Bacteroides sp. AM16-24]
MNEEQASAQIAFNFGPVNGNVEKQEIHLDKPVDKGDKSDNVVGDKGDDVAGGRGVLSVKQLIILFMEMLDVTLDASGINQSALAKLIAQVSGYAENTVRPKIAKGVDYDAKQTRQDAERIAALLDGIKPELAEKIRNNVRE